MKKILFISITLVAVLSIKSIAQITQTWAAVFNGTGNSADFSYSMVIDQSGNTYVTGESYTSTGNYDCVTLKYNLNGDTVWVRYYNGPANNRDIGRAIAVDAYGNVYVTGESYGSGDYDIVTIKYNSSGVQQWANRYNGPANGADGSKALATDTSGNVYITGYSDGDASTFLRQDDYVTIKYNSLGSAEWVSRYDGPSNFHDTPYAIAVDKDNNVFVTGGSSGVGTRYDYATVKYNPSGAQMWVMRYNGPANYNDVTKAIAVDDSGNVFVTGSSDGASSDNQDYATIKYNSDGVQQWLSRYDGSGGGDDAYAMVLDENSNLFVAGQSRNPVAPYSYDYLTIRYSTFTGDTVWTARYNGPVNSADVPLSVAFDKLSNVYVTGYSEGNGTVSDYATLKYNLTGAEQWVIRYNGLGNGSDVANSIAVDTMGNVFITGSSFGSGTANDIVTIKYSQSLTDVLTDGSDSPKDYHLLQNYPNPFNPNTIISYQLPVSSKVIIKVYDILGDEIATLVNEEKPAGNYEVNYNALQLSSGIYFYKMQAGSFINTKKMILIK